MNGKIKLISILEIKDVINPDIVGIIDNVADDMGSQSNHSISVMSGISGNLLCEDLFTTVSYRNDFGSYTLQDMKDYYYKHFVAANPYNISDFIDPKYKNNNILIEDRFTFK